MAQSESDFSDPKRFLIKRINVNFADLDKTPEGAEMKTIKGQLKLLKGERNKLLDRRDELSYKIDAMPQNLEIVELENKLNAEASKRTLLTVLGTSIPPFLALCGLLGYYSSTRGAENALNDTTIFTTLGATMIVLLVSHFLAQKVSANIETKNLQNYALQVAKKDQTNI